MRKYKNNVVLKVEPWTIVAAVVLVLVVGFMAVNATQPHQMSTGMMNQQMSSQMMTQLMEMMDQCMGQTDDVSGYVEAALAAEEFSGFQAHLGLALDLMNGENGLLNHSQMMSEMMQDSEAGIHKHMMGMPSNHHSQMMPAMQSVQQHLQSAHMHLTEAGSSQNLEMGRSHAQLGLDELQQAMGMSDTHDSMQGGMMYMHEQMQMMKNQMDHSH